MIKFRKLALYVLITVLACLMMGCKEPDMKFPKGTYFDTSGTAFRTNSLEKAQDEMYLKIVKPHFDDLLAVTEAKDGYVLTIEGRLKETKIIHNGLRVDGVITSPGREDAIAYETLLINFETHSGKTVKFFEQHRPPYDLETLASPVKQIRKVGDVSALYESKVLRDGTEYGDFNFFCKDVYVNVSGSGIKVEKLTNFVERIILSKC